MPITGLHPQITGNAGLYYVCYQLSLRGWNVMPTARNARGVDVIAYDSTGSRFIGVQVKALSRRNPVPLGLDLKKLMGDFWVVVINVQTQPVAFVMRPADVKAAAHKGEKEGRISYWLQPPKYDRPEFRENWDLIGRGDLNATP
jgi:hypothetical protein